MNMELWYSSKSYGEYTFLCAWFCGIKTRFLNILTMIELSVDQNHCNKKQYLDNRHTLQRANLPPVAW